ncbi:MAG: type II secretion system protein J [Bacteriovoracia bacterium]
MKYVIANQSGMSLLETMVVGSILISMGLITSSLVMTGVKSGRHVATVSDLNTLKYQLRALVNKDALCATAFKTANGALQFQPSANPQTPISITLSAIKSWGGETILAAPGKKIQGAKITSLQLTQSPVAPEMVANPSNPSQLFISTMVALSVSLQTEPGQNLGAPYSTIEVPFQLVVNPANGYQVVGCSLDAQWPGAFVPVPVASCPSGKVVTGLGPGGNPICAFPVPATSCASGTVVTGLNANGSPICANPPSPPNPEVYASACADSIILGASSTTMCCRMNRNTGSAQCKTGNINQGGYTSLPDPFPTSTTGNYSLQCIGGVDPSLSPPNPLLFKCCRTNNTSGVTACKSLTTGYSGYTWATAAGGNFSF